jgi:predicted NBD/HSP70 family sugar kinase
MCSYREFCEQTQDPLVDQIFCDIIEKMTIAIVSVQNMLNSDMVILGQDAVYWPDKYIRLLEDKINERKFSNRETRTLVAKPYFMEKTYVLGAACNVLSKIFHGEMPIPVRRTEA